MYHLQQLMQLNLYGAALNLNRPRFGPLVSVWELNQSCFYKSGQCYRNFKNQRAKQCVIIQ